MTMLNLNISWWWIKTKALVFVVSFQHSRRTAPSWKPRDWTKEKVRAHLLNVDEQLLDVVALLTIAAGRTPSIVGHLLLLLLVFFFVFSGCCRDPSSFSSRCRLFVSLMAASRPHPSGDSRPLEGFREPTDQQPSFLLSFAFFLSLWSLIQNLACLLFIRFFFSRRRWNRRIWE